MCFSGRGGRAGGTDVRLRLGFTWEGSIHMSKTSSSTIRKVAAGSALALAAAGGAFVTSPAGAGPSPPLDYTCATALGDKTFSVTHTVPDTVQYGGTVSVVSNVTVP